jgi:hypothetical protein
METTNGSERFVSINPPHTSLWRLTDGSGGTPARPRTFIPRERVSLPDGHPAQEFSETTCLMSDCGATRTDSGPIVSPSCRVCGSSYVSFSLC